MEEEMDEIMDEDDLDISDFDETEEWIEKETNKINQSVLFDVLNNNNQDASISNEEERLISPLHHPDNIPPKVPSESVDEVQEISDDNFKELSNIQESPVNIPLTNPIISDEEEVGKPLSQDSSISNDEVKNFEKIPLLEFPSPDSLNQNGETESHGPHEPELDGATPPSDIEGSITKTLRGLLMGYPGFINFENKEDTFSLIKDIILIYKLLHYCETKSKVEDVKTQLQAMRKDLENRGVLILIEFYNDFISRDMNFGMSRVRRRLDVFVNSNMDFLVSTIQFWLFCLPFRGKKDFHLDSAHGLPAATADEFEREQIEKGEKVTDVEGPFKIDEEGEVIQL